MMLKLFELNQGCPKCVSRCGLLNKFSRPATKLEIYYKFNLVRDYSNIYHSVYYSNIFYITIKYYYNKRSIIVIQGESRETDIFKEDKTLRIFKQKFNSVHKTFTKLCHYGILVSEKLCLTNDGHFHEQKFEVGFYS